MILRFYRLALAGGLTLGLALQAQACSVPANSNALQAEVLSHINAERKARGLARQPPLDQSRFLGRRHAGHPSASGGLQVPCRVRKYRARLW
jgi:hypothetical protein